MPRILIALPDRDFDVTEAATPWQRFVEAGHEVVFATESGRPGAADPLLVTGVVFGRLGAEPEALAHYARMCESPAFMAPLRHAEIDPGAYDALVLPGGHAAGMRTHLESEVLQATVLAFFKAGKPIGAICHGVLVLARTRDPATGRSILRGRRVTALTKLLERTAYWLTFWKHGRYYRTYPAYVQDEVSEALGNRSHFETGRAPWVPFVCHDGHLVTARWPKDAEVFARSILACVSDHTTVPVLDGGKL